MHNNVILWFSLQEFEFQSELCVGLSSKRFDFDLGYHVNISLWRVVSEKQSRIPNLNGTAHIGVFKARKHIFFAFVWSAGNSVWLQYIHAAIKIYKLRKWMT